MSEISLAETISAISVNDEWGPAITTATTLDGVPYAPYSKSDKLGRMADWTQEAKKAETEAVDNMGETTGINKFTAQAHPPFSPYKLPKMKPPSLLSTTPEQPQRAVASVGAV
ncbi:hypothetical protein CLAIMM_00419 [Cladophialophora immunda]|nr:hypothetical protein CLAIMM_00419 [Cladophialophora immunda]